MKFRTIYILFNVVVVASFLFVFFLPFFLLGSEYSLGFWKTNWYLALVFLVIIAGLNAFFIANWKIFTCVEREDWASLSTFLVDKIFTKKRFSSHHVALLVNAYLLMGDVEGIGKLEAELVARRPELLNKNAVLFGVTRLLQNKPAEAEVFFKDYLDAKGVENRDWLRFDYAFSLVLERRVPDALPFLREGLSSSDAVLSLLSAYLVGTLGAAAAPEAERAELQRISNSTANQLRKRFPGQKWEREVERAKGEVHIVILSKLIDDAGRWLFE
jgi:hypothetical protein